MAQWAIEHSTSYGLPLSGGTPREGARACEQHWRRGPAGLPDPDYIGNEATGSQDQEKLVNKCTTYEAYNAGLPSPCLSSTSLPIFSLRAISRGYRTSSVVASRAAEAPGAARRDGLGQDLHHGQRRPADPAADAVMATTDPGAQLRPSSRSSPQQRRRVLRVLLRLLPARGYIPRTDTYIEKDTLVNEDIERLRHSAMQSLLTAATSWSWHRVSCIYVWATPRSTAKQRQLARGRDLQRDKILRRLTDIYYERNDYDLSGQVPGARRHAEVHPSSQEIVVRVSFWG